MKSERFRFTRHALNRYIERVDPTLDLDAARDALEASSPIKLVQRGRADTTLWLLEDPRAYLVTKPEDGEHVCVTVLGPGECGFDDRDAPIALPGPPAEPAPPAVVVAVLSIENERAKKQEAKRVAEDARQAAHQAMMAEHAVNRAAKEARRRAHEAARVASQRALTDATRVAIRFLMEHQDVDGAGVAIERIRAICDAAKLGDLLRPGFYTYERKVKGG